MLLLNTPHNPTGRVLSLEELEELASMLQKYPQVIVVMDEVYENLVYCSKGHSRLASLPSMWNRTITVSSAGKVRQRSEYWESSEREPCRISYLMLMLFGVK